MQNWNRLFWIIVVADFFLFIYTKTISASYPSDPLASLSSTLVCYFTSGTRSVAGLIKFANYLKSIPWLVLTIY